MVKLKSINKTETIGKIPEGVWILAVIMFVSAIFSFLLALSMFNVANPTNYQLVAMQFEYQGQDALPPGSFIGMGLLFIVFGFISYYVARGLLRLQNKARIVLIMILILGIIASIFSLFMLKQYYTSIYLVILQLIALKYCFKKKVILLFK